MLIHTKFLLSPSSEIFRFAQNDIACGLSFFGQALNNTSERSEVSLVCLSALTALRALETWLRSLRA